MPIPKRTNTLRLFILGSIAIACGLFIWIYNPLKKVPENSTPFEVVPNDEESGSLYMNEEYGVTLRYNDSFTQGASEDGTYFVWDGGTPMGFASYLHLELSPSFQPQTNFRGAAINLFALEDGVAQQYCLTAQQGEVAVGNKNDWTVFSRSDAGAGNLYQTQSYRMIKNGACIALETVIHSTQLANYPPELGITAFDQQLVEQTLLKVVDSTKVQ